MTPTTPAPVTPSPVQLMDQLAQAAAGYYRAFATVAAERGLTLMQGKMLSLLRRPMPMRTLADLLACDASNVTGIVDRLEARGLARREVDPADRRIKNVVLTEQGEETVRAIRAELMSSLTGLEQLDDEERRTFQELLVRVFPLVG
ncbi:DNA-binding MarR family transcriptional regulator [Kitasatospora sp. MAA4]|uniref:MarR family winged helix-turn-helix transcriptional regulator n=1 Tax=Kitasatospora sp. MAA4 TaxID=3035093 RepID=UPI002476E30D|nr:MarR family transcriptional regulator [Kitasatospora sp. MAA4]MDH6131060.1 DNA-binding MarR family transcriptional regulator [Kitasatospora sp. MAA4]